MTYAAMARDVLEFAQDLHEGNVHVMGHSMGGKVAMELAISYPHIVDRLIVVDVAPRAFEDPRPAVVKALRSLDLSLHSDRDSIEEELAKDFESASVRQLLMKNLRRVDGRYVWLPNLAALERSYENIAGPITAKGIFEGDALFIRGGQSDYIRDSDLSDILNRFPSSEIVTIEAAGHWVHADAPDAFARTVSEFLAAAVPVR
jgi:pimeloyl-ACP methyl ester carboxylesterase